MDKIKKRKVEVVVISDVHLGTFGSKATELLNYLKTVNPKNLVLNGDIIDIWQFNKRYFPKDHMKVIKYLTSLLDKETNIYYITGNHDEMLRKFSGFKIGSFEIVNKLVLNLDGKKAWIFHGDVFDVTMKHSKWLAKLGGFGYDFLILINTLVNWFSEKLGRGRISFSKRIKNSVKGAIKHINNFEETVIDIAMQHGYDYVICGHIHQPKIKEVKNKNSKKLMYLNSGDWVENMTALEFNKGKWSLYNFIEDDSLAKEKESKTKEPELLKIEYKSKQIFNELIKEFQINPSFKKSKLK